jgi:hypothetical protein
VGKSASVGSWAKAVPNHGHGEFLLTGNSRNATEKKRKHIRMPFWAMGVPSPITSVLRVSQYATLIKTDVRINWRQET